MKVRASCDYYSKSSLLSCVFLKVVWFVLSVNSSQKNQWKPEEAVSFMLTKRQHILLHKKQWEALRNFYKADVQDNLKTTGSWILKTFIPCYLFLMISHIVITNLSGYGYLDIYAYMLVKNHVWKDSKMTFLSKSVFFLWLVINEIFLHLKELFSNPYVIHKPCIKAM